MKTYGVAITAGGVTYYFHCDTASKVRDLVNGSSQITKLIVTEETSTNHKVLTDSEVLYKIFLSDTARVLEFVA
jgi:hypothetical protein